MRRLKNCEWCGVTIGRLEPRYERHGRWFCAVCFPKSLEKERLTEEERQADPEDLDEEMPSKRELRKAKKELSKWVKN